MPLSSVISLHSTLISVAWVQIRLIYAAKWLMSWNWERRGNVIAQSVNLCILWPINTCELNLRISVDHLSSLNSITRSPKKTNCRNVQTKECYCLKLSFTGQTTPGIQYQCHTSKGTPTRTATRILKVMQSITYIPVQWRIESRIIHWVKLL